MARKFTLTNVERADCFRAINFGTQKGFLINDQLDLLEPLLKELKQGLVANEEGIILLNKCDEKTPIKLSEPQYKRLIDDLKKHPWTSASQALIVKELIKRLDDIPPIKEGDKNAKTTPEMVGKS